MAVSQPDHPNFSSQGNPYSGCDQMAPSELKSTNIDTPSWTTAVDSTRENLWPRFPILNSRVPPTTKVEEWSSRSITETDSQSTTKVMMDLGSSSTTVPSVQPSENITSREQSPQMPMQLTVSDCNSIDADRVSRRTTAFPSGVARSPTVGSETRSPTGRSMEHLAGLPGFNLSDGAAFPSVIPKTCVGDSGGALPNKRAFSAYYGIPSPIKHPVDAGLQYGSLWSQQHLWSKSAPQHLHGIHLSTACEPTSVDAVSSCSVPDSTCLHLGPHGHLVVRDSHNPDSIGQSINSGGYSAPPVIPPPLNAAVSVVDEERGLHQPDGADHPDEHMWLYEDPQGRTQGTFSDAQMHDWLSEGIYFTESLRVRRKCDDSFSTLAQYCQLFGRIPFHSGPRVSPILGGITPSMLVSSGHGERCSPSGLPPTNHMHHLRSFSHGPVTTEFSSPIGGHIASVSGLSLGATNTGSSSLTANQRSPYKLDHEPGAHYPTRRVFPSNTVEDDRTSTNKLGSGMYFDGSLPAAPNRTPPLQQARPPLLPHDLSSLGSSSMSPGFLSALAQYLSPNANPATTMATGVGPTLASGTPVSPMQHLAETAQLAAQLAAMAGAHSPDQTPMHPSQALALAEMLISSHLSPSNWPPSQTKREGHAPGGSGGAVAPAGACLPTEFRADKSGSGVVDGGGNEVMHSQVAGGLHVRGDDALKNQPSWSAISDALEKDLRISCDGDGALTKTSRENTTTKQRHVDSSKNNRPGNSQKCQQNKVSGSSVGVGDLNNSVSVTSPGGYGKREGQLTFADSLQRSPNTSYLTSPWKRAVGGGSDTTDSISNNSHFPTADHLISTKVSPSSRTHAGVEGDGAISCVDVLQSPLKSQACQSDPSELVPAGQSMSELSAAAEGELELLTQWSIGRLSSIPMREKVDIPTVVELLATLDAPYEVERMVSTFLGESSRATQFVKDFLDHRRPFWKLHRQLRENSIVVVGHSAASLASSNTAAAAAAGNHANSTVVGVASTTALSDERSAPGNATHSTTTTSGGKKKKRTSAGGNAGGVVTTASIGNHVLKRQSSAGGDSSADNQWHHIKPKSNHHRKANKGIDRKVAS